MAHAVRGFLLLSVYSGGFSAICPIRHFNAPARRFNVWGYPYTAAATLALRPLFMALWRGVAPPAPRLAACAVRLPPPLFPCCFAGGGLLRWCGLGGAPVNASPCVALRQNRRESRWHSRCESRKRLHQSRSFYPKIIVVYKIPCIKAGFFLPTFP